MPENVIEELNNEGLILSVVPTNEVLMPKLEFEWEVISFTETQM